MAESKFEPEVSKTIIEKPATLTIELDLEEAVVLYIVMGGIGGSGKVRSIADRFTDCVSKYLRIDKRYCLNEYTEKNNYICLNADSSKLFEEAVKSSNWRF